MKYHLAQIPRHEVGICTKTNLGIIHRAVKSLEEIETTKVTKTTLNSQMVGGGVVGFGGDHESGTGSSSTSVSVVNPTVASSFFVP